MAKAKKAKLPEIDSPVNDQECDAYILQLGVLHRQLTKLEADMNDALARAKAAYEERADPLRQLLADYHGAIEIYCTEHRARLTGGGRVKMYRFGNGEVAWRLRPASVTIRRVKNALAWLVEAPARFKPLLRIKHEIDKEAMLRWPELASQVPGVTVGSAGEQFTVTPNEMKLERAAE
ncbi:host-nuclease inhibitor Gam family protein [Dongia deserti]|uniref:host-nuclease inhibitor Gam family protein n=1 Tax=Dongia deserti TaxID=2268030 RepID=UPI0013C3F333|nr:host-nuclease inhibitor Gam family protein [Dongia deserti]